MTRQYSYKNQDCQGYCGITEKDTIFNIIILNVLTNSITFFFFFYLHAVDIFIRLTKKENCIIYMGAIHQTYDDDNSYHTASVRTHINCCLISSGRDHSLKLFSIWSKLIWQVKWWIHHVLITEIYPIWLSSVFF